MCTRAKQKTFGKIDESLLLMHTEKYFRILIKSTQNQIVFTIIRLTWIQTDFRLDLNQSENGKCNLISGWFNKISKIFLCVCLAWMMIEMHCVTLNKGDKNILALKQFDITAPILAATFLSSQSSVSMLTLIDIDCFTVIVLYEENLTINYFVLEMVYKMRKSNFTKIQSIPLWDGWLRYTLFMR